MVVVVGMGVVAAIVGDLAVVVVPREVFRQVVAWLFIASYKLQVTSYKLQVTSFKLQVTSYLAMVIVVPREVIRQLVALRFIECACASLLHANLNMNR